MLLLCITPAYAWDYSGLPPAKLPEYAEECIVISSEWQQGRLYYYLHGYNNWFDALCFVPAPDLTELGIENGMMKI